MIVSGVRLCLIVLLTCVIVDTLVEGSSWRRHHDHHSRLQHHGLKNPMSLDLLSKHLKNSGGHSRHHDINQQRERHGYLETGAHSFPSLEYENVEEVQTPVVHRHREVPKNHRQESLRIREADTRSKYENSAKGTRHVRHSNYLEAQANSFPSSEYEDVEALTSMGHRRRRVRFSDEYDYSLSAEDKRQTEEAFEFEVKEVQKRSVCNYFIERDNDSTRVPEKLEHIKCDKDRISKPCFNKKLSNELDLNTYCCIQTLQYITASYKDGSKRNVTHYVGCVCANQKELPLAVEPAAQHNQ